MNSVATAPKFSDLRAEYRQELLERTETAAGIQFSNFSANLRNMLAPPEVDFSRFPTISFGFPIIHTVTLEGAKEEAHCELDKFRTQVLMQAPKSDRLALATLRDLQKVLYQLHEAFVALLDIDTINIEQARNAAEEASASLVRIGFPEEHYLCKLVRVLL